MKDEIKAVWGVDELPVELDRLIDFQEERSGYECYSEGCGVGVDDKQGLSAWSDDEAFLARLFPVAQANGTGSTYVVWDDGSGRPLGQMPVVVFGDEGGVHVVAGNLLQLLRLLTYDAEISVDHDDAYFFKDEDDHDESEDQGSYREWLMEEFSVKPVKKPGTIIRKAQSAYQSSFDRWMAQYHADDVDDQG